MRTLLDMTSLLWALAVRNILRNKRRSGLTLLAVAVGIGSSLVLAALGRGIAANMRSEAILQFTGHIKVTAPDYVNDPVVHHRFPLTTAASKLRAELDAAQVVPRVKVPAVLMSERDSLGINLIGADPTLEQQASFVANSIIAGTFLSEDQPNGIVVGKKNLELLQTKLGRRVVVMSESSEGEISDAGFKIIGVFEGKTEGVERNAVLVNLSTAQKLLGVGNDVTEVTTVLADPSEISRVKSIVKKYFPALSISTWDELEPLVSAMLELQSAFLVFWFLIVSLTVVFGLVNTMFMSLFERTYELGLSQALGMSRMKITVMVMLESIVLLLFGAFLGCCIAIVSIYLLRDGIDITELAGAGADYIGISKIIRPSIQAFDWWVVNTMVVGLGVLASIYPSLKGSSMEPAKAMRDGRK